jgi:hypothetical protein
LFPVAAQGPPGTHLWKKGLVAAAAVSKGPRKLAMASTTWPSEGVESLPMRETKALHLLSVAASCQ